MIKDAFIEFKNSKNKIHVIQKYNASISGFFAVLTIVLGTIGFVMNEKSIDTGFLNSIKMFGLDFPSQHSELNLPIVLAIISAIITISLVALLFFVKESLDTYLIERIFKRDHIAVFGLGEASISFLNSYSLKKGNEDIAIIEADPDNKKLEEFRKNGVGVFIGDSLSDKALDLLNFKKMKYAIIAMGSDKINIELAKKIINLYGVKNVTTPIKLIIHIQNRDLDILFHQNFMLPDLDKKLEIDIKTFSFFNEAAEELIENHSIVGDTDKYLNSKIGFRNIIIGNGEFIKSIIYQMALISHLPNQNIHTVYIVDKNANEILIEIEKHLYYQAKTDKAPDNFPSFKIEAVEIDRNSLEYFEDAVWTMKELVNVIIAYDDENENLDLAIELFNRTYLSKAVDGDDMPKIIFAIYDQLLLSKIINKDQGDFKNFYTFGNSENVLSYNNLIEEEKYLLARLIHSKYVENKPGEDNKDTWYSSAKYSDKLSSIAQTQHINMKLNSMGFKKKYILEGIIKLNKKHKEGTNQPNEDVDIEEIAKKLNIKKYKNDIEELNALKVILLKKNRDIISKVFEEYRKELDIEDMKLAEYYKNPDELFKEKNGKVKYFPKAYDTLFDKMIRMEHNRWNAYHFLNGWKYEAEEVYTKPIDKEEKKDLKAKRKSKKKHECLIPLKDFTEIDMQKTVKYDIYSFLHLPDYLAEAGYLIVPWKKT